MRRLLLWLWKVLPLGRRSQFAAMWLLNSRFLVGVVGIVLDDARRVLLVKHAYRNEFPWGLPSGWARRGEQPQEAIAREISEETGIPVEVVSVLEVSADPALPRLDLVFLCRPAGGGPPGVSDKAPRFAVDRPDQEVTAAAFFDPVEAPARLLPGQEALIRQALTGLPPARRPPRR